jgi:predicted kinase
VLADVAFLAMDLERLGSRADADRFLAWYRGFSGESYPASLADFYVAYRACIRAKVACLKHEQGDEPALQRARSLLDLCERRLDRGRVRLVLVGGLPGTGKSTLASTLSARTGWSMLRSDEVRKDVTGTPHVDHHKHRFGSDIYSDAQTERTYKELLERARRLLGYGESVILDASWIREEHRRWAATLARETSSDVLPIRCVLDARIAAERMHRRRAEGTDPSDADARVAAAMAVRFEPWPDAREVSTARSTEDVAQAVCDAFGLDR